MPEMTPVGNTIIPPNPNQGISTISGILGLRQQQQALQTGAYQQQAVQADAQQAQQKNQEMARAQAIAIEGAKNGTYDTPDGLDRQKMADDILKVAPTYGQPIIGQLLSHANEIVANKQAHQNLDVSQQQQMGSTFGALATKKDLTPSDFIDALNTLTDHNKDPSFKRMALSMMGSVPANGSPQQLQELARRWGIASTSPESASGQSNPNVSTMQAPGGLQAINTNPQAPGGVGPVGPAQAQGVAPGIVATPAGPLARTGPSGTTLTPLTTAGPPNAAGAPPGPDLNPTKVQQTVNLGSAEGVTTRVQQAQAAANNTVHAQDALTRARSILDSADSPNTGVNFSNKQFVKNFLADVGIDTKGADDANTLAKNLARYEASRATQAGLGGTDAARELAHNGSPNVNLDKGALKGVITQSLATEKALSAYAGIQSKTKDPAALAKNEADFRNIPNLVQGYEYGLARTPAEADEFLKKHNLTRADMAKTRQRIKEFESR